MMIRISFSFKAGPVYYASWRKAYMGALASKASLQNEPILQALTSGNFVRKSRQRWVTGHSGESLTWPSFLKKLLEIKLFAHIFFAKLLAKLAISWCTCICTYISWQPFDKTLLQAKYEFPILLSLLSFRKKALNPISTLASSTYLKEELPYKCWFWF